MYLLSRKVVNELDELDIQYYLINKFKECIQIELVKSLDNYIWDNWIEVEETRCKMSGKFTPTSLTIISLKDIVKLLSHSDLKKYINLIAN